MGLSAVFPVFHGLVLYGLSRLNRQISLFWLVLQGFLYILGAAFYAVRTSLFKSLLFPGLTRNMTIGSYTREAISREIRPLGQFAPDFPHPCSPGCNGSSRRITEGIRLCAKISCLLTKTQSQCYRRLHDWGMIHFQFGPDAMLLGQALCDDQIYICTIWKWLFCHTHDEISHESLWKFKTIDGNFGLAIFQFSNKQGLASVLNKYRGFWKQSIDEYFSYLGNCLW